MATNISNLPISSSFQDLVIESGSILQNATGSVINNLTITSSFAITASHATNVPATASFAVRATSASMADSASYAVSASVEIVKEVSSSYADVAGVAQNVAGGDVDGAVASASFAETASFLLGSVSSASYAVSSSVATLANSSSYAVLASDARDLIIGVKSSQATTILKGQTLHAVGVTGENINVVTASNDNSANMPAIAVANENINAGAASTAIISGKIVGIDTDGLVAGANVYVGANGGFTGTKPTGTALIQNIGVVGKIDAIDGELIVLGSGRSNDLPNITSGYAWVGNENQVPIAVSTASFSAVTASYAISASIASNADSASNATSASIADELSQLATASFADRATTASFAVSASIPTLQEVTDAGNITDNILYVDSGVILFDQELTGSYAGLTRSTIRLDANGSIIRNSGSADESNTIIDWAIRAGGSQQDNQFYGTSSFALSSQSSSLAENADSASNANRAVTASIADDIKSGINVSFNSGSFANLTATTASIGFLRTVTGSATIIGDEFIILNADTPTVRYAGIKVYDSGSAQTASLEWDGDTDNWILAEESGNTAVIITGPTGSRASEVSPTINNIQKGGGHHTIIDSSITDTGTAVTIGNTTTFSNGASGSFSGSFEGELLVTASNALFATNALSASYAESASVATLANTASNAVRAISASHADTASFYSGNVISSSFAESSSFAQDARTADSASVAARATTLSADATASFADLASDARTATSASTAITASHAMSIPGVITNDITFNGSVNGAVAALSIASDTASMDLSAGNFFTLAMPAGGAVHLNPTNIQAGQTVNLKVTQNASAATLNFNSLVRFESGSEFTVSTGSGDCDMISFVTFDTSNLYGAGINHLIGY